MLLYDDLEIEDYSNDIVKKYYQVLHESEYDDSQFVKEAEITSQEIDEATDYYNKVQQILDVPEMKKCHPFLYSLDLENLNESSKKKIKKIYNLGVTRGMIRDPEEEGGEEGGEDCGGDCGAAVDECGDICGSPESDISNSQFDAISNTDDTNIPLETGCTVMYRATKNGVTKTGEYYSKVCDFNAAKTACINDMTDMGYSNVEVISVEGNGLDNVDSASLPVDPIVDELGDCIYEDDVADEKQETGDQDEETDDKQAGAENTDTAEEGGEKEDEPKEDDSKDDTETEPKEDGAEKKEDSEDNPPAENTEETSDKADSEEKDNEEGAEDDEESKDEDGEGEEKKLTTAERVTLKTDYTEVFKSVLASMKLEKSFNDMNLKEKNDFITKLSEKWTKQDPEEFMSNKDQEALWNKKIKNS